MQLRDDHRAMLIAALRLDNDTPHPICSVTINSTTKDEVLKERLEPWSETESDWQILLVDGEPPSRRDLRKERRYPRPPVPTDFWGGYVRFIDFDGVTVTEETSEYVKFTGKHVVPVTTNGERGEDMVSTVEVYVDPATDLLQRFNVELDDSYRFSRLFALIESRQEMSFVDRSDFAFPRYDAVTMDATVRIDGCHCHCSRPRWWSTSTSWRLIALRRSSCLSVKRASNAQQVRFGGVSPFTCGELTDKT